MKRFVSGLMTVAYLSTSVALPLQSVVADDGPRNGDTIQLSTNDQKTRTLWVSAATYSVNRRSDYSLVLLTDLLIDFYKKHPDTDIIQVREALAGAKAEYAERARMAREGGMSGSMKGAFDSMNLMLDVVGQSKNPTVKAFVEGAKVYLKVNAKIYEKVIGPKEQGIAQMKQHGDRMRAQMMANRVFNEAHLLAHDEARFAQLFNFAIGDELGIYTHNSIQELNQAFPELAKNETIKVVQQMFVQGQVSKKELMKLYRQEMAKVNAQYEVLQGQIADLQKGQEELQATSNDILVILEGMRANEASRAAAEHARQERQIIMAGAQASVQVLSTLVGFSDPKLARAMSVTGNAVIQTVDAIDQFAKILEGGFSDLAVGMGAAIMTGNILGAVLSIVSLFGDPGPTPEQVILEQIQALQKQVANLGKMVEARFDQLDMMIRNVYRDVMEQFAIINARLDRIDEGLADVRDALARQERQLNRIESNLDSYFRDQLVREFWKDRIHCIQSREYFPNSALSASRFRSCLINFQNRAMVDSVTTPEIANANANYSDSLDLAATLSSDRLYANTDFLFRMAPSFSNNARMSPHFDRIPNIMTWMMGAEAYMQTMLEWPEHAHLASPIAIDQMISMGEHLQESLTNLAFRKSRSGRYRARTPFFGSLINNYKVRLSEVRLALQKLAADYQKTHTNGYSIYSGQYQDSPGRDGFKVPDKISPCADSALKHYDINTPINLDLIIPSEVRMASKLLNSPATKLTYCYKAEWSDRREVPYCVDPWIRAFTEKRARLKVTFRAMMGGRVFHEQVAKSLEHIIGEGSRAGTGCDDWGYRETVAHKFSDSLKSAMELSWDRFWREFILGKQNRGYGEEHDRAFKEYYKDGAPTGAGLMAYIERFDNVTNKTTHDAVITQATEVIMKELDRHRDLFWRQRVVPNLGSGELARALKRLTGAKLLIQSYLELLLPNSIESDNRLRGLLYGNTGIMSGEDVAQGLVENEKFFLDRLIVDGSISVYALPPTDMEVRIDALQRALLLVLSNPKLGGLEKNPVLEDMLIRLRAFKAIHWPQAS